LPRLMDNLGALLERSALDLKFLGKVLENVVCLVIPAVTQGILDQGHCLLRSIGVPVNDHVCLARDTGSFHYSVNPRRNCRRRQVTPSCPGTVESVVRSINCRAHITQRGLHCLVALLKVCEHVCCLLGSLPGPFVWVSLRQVSQNTTQ